MKRNKRSGFSWRNLLTNKVFDLLIVIAGVTIAFQLNNLKTNRDQKSLERFYLEGLVSDIDNDLIEYNDNLAELRSDLKSVYACLVRIERAENVTDSVGLVAWNLLSMKTFEGHRNTYSTILSSNGLSLIRDRAIRSTMMEHYRLYASIERFETDYSTLIWRIHDYFSEYIDYNHVRKINNRGFAGSIQTKNLLTISAVQLQNGIWRYEGSIAKAQELKAGILAVLK